MFPSRMATPGTPAIAASASIEDAQLLVQRDGEGILVVRRPVRVRHWRGVVKGNRLALRDARRAGDLERLAGDALGLLGVEHGAGAEPPRAIDQHPHAEAGAGVRGGCLERAVLDGQPLVLPLDDSDVGIRSAPALCRVQGPVDEFLHGSLVSFVMWWSGADRLLDRAGGLWLEIAPAGGHEEVVHLAQGEASADRLLEEAEDAARSLDRGLEAVG